MLELLTTAQMAEADRLAIAGGVPGIELMERAGAAVAEVAAARVPNGRLLVLCGPGNNGGDGFVAARRLRAAGRDVALHLLGDPARITGDARAAFDRWGGPTHPADVALPEAAGVIDALFGAGLDRPIDGRAARIVTEINGRGVPVIAVDVPSGVSGDTGEVMGTAIEAAATVTFFRLKPGHLLYPGRDLCGDVTLADIGIPAAVLDTLAPRVWRNGRVLWAKDMRAPTADGHKYHRGHAVVVSGGMARTGAARLAAGAALRAGAGLVTLASPPEALAVNAAHLTAVMLRRMDGAEGLAALLADPRISVAALGPGLGTGAAEQALVTAALAAPAALVLDADALTLWQDAPDALFAAIAGRAAPVVLTPHEGEFARLFPDLAGPKPARARAAAARSGATVVLKGPDTVIAAPDGRLAINGNAPAWLATAGSGDVLAGIATGLLAQGVPGFEAAGAAVWFHGAAGTEAGPGLTAEDSEPALRGVLRRLWAPTGFTLP
ncbi:MAG: NAD(P)H-hydrate dehydratase [Amaricoccus sp.]|uniref:NAD(P)H-hydrate dehydratase n=1 Tax=Amaricoccus sp. TaxID=1872485 RepID=UPI0039E6F4B5